MWKSVYRILLTTSLALAVSVAADHNAFNGTWKLNVSKSKFESPATKSQTVAITDDLVAVDQTIADGKQRHWSYKAGEGQDLQITGLENSRVSSKQVDARTIEHNWAMETGPSSGRAVLSRDGKTMTYTLTGKTPEGKPFKNVMIFEKQ